MESMMLSQVRSCKQEDAAYVRRLLADCKLPTADVESHLPDFVVAELEGRVVGVAGLELLGDSALLRSVAVAEPHRDHGTGKELFRVVSAKARAQKVRKLYLLTTTAAAYFERLGFSRLERSAAPAEVRATREYSQLCPDSSQLMVKDL